MSIIQASELKHYRTEHSTYIDTDIWASDFSVLTSLEQAAYLRLLTGPEHEESVGVDFDEVLPALLTWSDEASEDPVTLIRRLRTVGLIVLDGNLITFPNVEYGEPPCHEQLGPEQYCADCGTYNPGDEQ